MKILVTGAAGFIGFHVSKILIEEGHDVIGFDSINDYYDVSLKHARLSILGITNDNENIIEKKSSIHHNFYFIKGKLESQKYLERIFKNEKFDVVCHLAAQAGVRYSIVNPKAYIDSNITGFFNILEMCRNSSIKHLVYASSSSVYGMNKKMPFSVNDNVDKPISLYAATKKSNELMAYTYSYLFGIPTTGLRFFTVYGPWGRPDMAPIIFSRSILNGEKIKIFNNGKMERDFTYIDDVAKGVVEIIKNPFKTDEIDKVPYAIHNIGKGNPIKLLDFIAIIEQELGKKAKLEFMPIQPGDVIKTWADTQSLVDSIKYKPETTLNDGLKKFVKWFLEYEESIL